MTKKPRHLATFNIEPSPSVPKTQRHDRHGRRIPRNPSQDQPMQRFIETVNKDALELILGQDERYHAFLHDLYNPRNSRRSFASIAVKHGLTLDSLHRIYTDGMRHYGLIEMSNRLPQVMVDVAEDSFSKMVCCPRCDGLKRLQIGVTEPTESDPKGTPILRDCPVCHATGEIRVPGDKDARNLMFEAMKLTGKGTTVAIQQNFGHGSLEDDLQLTQKIIMGDNR